MHTDKTNLNNPQKPQGKPIDAGATDKSIDGRVDQTNDQKSGMHETQPRPGSESPGQVAKM